ncbi:glycine betaine ABC transporter substrate-binding protein [Kocuria carniphila]|uniref:glycine betaine ABC transporter substrate-binding protein n=2 Tax=Kocuria carniphila TaxID=262208 RepID=UPI0036234533
MTNDHTTGAHHGAPLNSRGVTKTSPTRSRVGLMGIALTGLLALTACDNGGNGPATGDAAPEPTAAASSPGTEAGGPVRIATGVSDQTRVVAHMYAQQLREQGIGADVVDAGRERNELFDALQANEVDLLPDFTGDLYVHVAENETPASPSNTPTPAPTASEDPGFIGSLAQLLGFTGETGPSGDDVYDALPDSMPKGLQILNESPGQNTDRFVVTPATAVELELDDLTSVGEHCSDMAIGMPGNYADSDQGVKGLESYYDCKPKSAPELAEYSERVDALLNNEVQAAVLPESSPVIDDDDLRVLDDPNNLYRPEKLVAVASEGLTGDAVSAVNGITSNIRTGDLAMMTRLVSGENPDMTPEEAAAFIREQPR